MCKTIEEINRPYFFPHSILFFSLFSFPNHKSQFLFVLSICLSNTNHLSLSVVCGGDYRSLYRFAAPSSSQRRVLKEPFNSRFDDFTLQMMSQHSRRKLPRGNPRKSKHAEADRPASPKAAEPTSSNRLLAGYLAHEFLTKGTLLGRKFELDSAEPKKSKLKSQAAASAVEPRQSARKEQDSYVEVARILKIDGAHIKGIVNPTQLCNWINK